MGVGREREGIKTESPGSPFSLTRRCSISVSQETAKGAASPRVKKVMIAARSAALTDRR